MKPSEIFEGENSGLRKAFDEAVGREQSHIGKTLAEFEEMFGRARSSRSFKGIRDDGIKAFLTSSIHQAIAEERERVRGIAR